MKAIKNSVLALVFVVIAGCNWSPVEVEQQAKMRRVASRDDLSVYVVTVDGSDYLIVHTTHGAAITPKVKPE